VVDPSLPVHPTFLYESLWNLIGFGLIVWYTKRRRFNSELTFLYCGWYGLGRFFIEGLRTDSLMLGPLRISQVVAAIAVLASVGLWVAFAKKFAREPADWMLLYDADAQAEEEADGGMPPEPDPENDEPKKREAEDGEDAEEPGEHQKKEKDAEPEEPGLPGMPEEPIPMRADDGPTAQNTEDAGEEERAGNAR
jgi:phosphatidylglycerol:prolipoprotein diacylglycerol transferase